MFQRFTSLFFSDSSTPDGLEEPKAFISREEEEDGWLIIDIPGEKFERGLLDSRQSNLSQNGKLRNCSQLLLESRNWKILPEDKLLIFLPW